MGTWISHLRIAERVFAQRPELDEVAFTYGNLAPDSGIPNADWTVFDPPKTVTHFLEPGEGEGRIRDLEFYRGYLMAQPLAGDPVRHSFLLGYFCHLLADNLWSKLVGAPTKVAWAAEFATEGPELWDKIKQDWYDLDQCYIRDTPNSSFWRVVMVTPNPPVHVPFVPLAGLHAQLDYIRQFYSVPDPAQVLTRPYPYLRATTMDHYVTDASAAILTILAALPTMEPELQGPTALALLPPAAVAPYPLPLGDQR